MKRRVVVTGLGAIASLGKDVNTLWKNLLAGKNGVTRINRFDPSKMDVQIAAEVKEFNPAERFDHRLIRRTERFSQFAMWAAVEAVGDSKLNFDEENRDAVGVIVGSGMGGLESWEAEHEKFLAKGPASVSPLLITKMIPDIAAGQIAIYYQLRGPNFCTTSACASGGHAIGEAFRFIVHGDADIIVAGGAEAPITPFGIAGFGNMKAASRRNSEPEKASRPFDRNRDGFVTGEGAGIVILEELEHALKRNAKIYCEMAGYGATADAYHITAPHPEGKAAYEAMRMAIEEANIRKEEIDYINAHGTSTILNDLTETLAIKKLFGDHAKKIAISASKSMIGHLLGGAGAIEFLITALSIYHQKVHPTINLENPDKECDLDYVIEGARDMNIRTALSNSFGFGGHNSVLAAKHFSRA